MRAILLQLYVAFVLMLHTTIVKFQQHLDNDVSDVDDEFSKCFFSF